MRTSIFAASAVIAVPTLVFGDPCTAPVLDKGRPFTGIVRYIVDGDGFCVGETDNPHEWIEVRVADFYAPELKTSEGRAAKAVMAKIAMGKQVSCVAGRKSYDRTIAQCTVDGARIGDIMRRAGVREGGNL